MMDKLYILDGTTPVKTTDLEEWERKYQECNRVIARDSVGESNISTVFLGMDHQFGAGEPLLFETMVFGGPLDGFQNRYSTWKEALAGHKEIENRLVFEQAWNREDSEPSTEEKEEQ